MDARDWCEVRRILQEKVPHLEVWAFGSRARRTAKPYSDLDLAMITEQPLSLAQLADLNDAFDSSDLPIRVDVVDWLPPATLFATSLRKTKVVVQTRSGTDTKK
ncbi:MAG: nucleotidyltransferase domain-containing protein [Rhodoferax sp.]|nr:nucleotidyltransferase domain-containing protein [Rhodoferax sp.]